MDGLAVAFQVVAQGLRLPLPEGTPTEYADLLSSCMSLNAEQRPTATEIIARLQNMNKDGRFWVERIVFMLGYIMFMLLEVEKEKERSKRNEK